MMRTMFLIARKGLRLLLRDRMALFWVLVFPTVLRCFWLDHEGWSSLIMLAMIGGAMVPPSVMPDWLCA